MTVGTNINASERANAAFGLINILGMFRSKLGKGACDSAPDYDAMSLGADFYANPPSPDWMMNIIHLMLCFTVLFQCLVGTN